MTALNPVPAHLTSGQVTSANTVITCTLPTYSVGDCLILILNSNNAQTTFTLSAAITSFTVVAGGSGNRTQALSLVPNGGSQTTFTVTGASAVWTWVILNYSGASLSALPTTSLNSAVDAYGSVTTTPVPVPQVIQNFVATGNEVLVSVVGVNATATWTTTGATQFHTTANNAALMINAVNLSAGGLTGVSASMTRAAGTLNQTALAFVLQQAPLGPVNLLANPSFEAGSTLATGWTDEHTTATEATYSLTATGATDGALAQKIVYTGVLADGGTAKTEIYQSPITASAGQLLVFSVWLSGSLTSLYGFIGIEGFSSGQVYISESDTNFTVLSGTPTLYTVYYLCPAGTVAVAAYLQVPSIALSTSFSITMDQAVLQVASNVTGVAAGVTVLGGAGTLEGDQNLTGVAAAVAATGGAGTFATGQNLTGVAAQVTAAGGAGVPAGAAGVTGVAAGVVVAGGIGIAAAPVRGSVTTSQSLADPVTLSQGTAGASVSNKLSTERVTTGRKP